MGKDRAAVSIRVTGLVQGVGFRPTVYRLAVAMNLTGEVFNDAAGVGIRLEGDPQAVADFPRVLRENKPPLARIDSITTQPIALRGDTRFCITATRAGGHVTTAITADAATCRECFADLFDPQNRRYRYAFTNCTHCGPRYTITRHLPYDRAQTSMGKFPMCPACQREYDDPMDRRFHAQPNACPVCGPQLSFIENGHEVAACDPVREAVRVLREGRILALKGLGGFHLVCDAANPAAVERLRERKHRPEKPLAVMVANLPSARLWVHLSPKEEEVLASPLHPILLAPKKDPASLQAVAPMLDEIGVLLPYTPLHGLLFHTLAGEPAGMDWFEHQTLPDILVMTSANYSGEPIIADNDEALAQLGDVADAFLVHNRDIVIRCDDSVLRVQDGQPLWVRRSRGAVPQAIALKHCAGPDVLALGPYLKNTVCLLRGDEAVLSQHIGDLQNAAQCRSLDGACEHLESILETKPQAYSCDLHPDFYSTQRAQELAAAAQLTCMPIAHHAAHIGAVMAEEGITESCVGVALDGVGLGADGGIWGGELLEVGPTGFSRLGHLLELPLPGGDRAAREPWRCAAAVLQLLGKEELIPIFFGEQPMSARIAQLIASPHTPKTSSMGRWFDAASALLGLIAVQHDEATAAMRLESAGRGKGQVLKQAWCINDGVLDLLPLFSRLVAAREAHEDAGLWAGNFQETLAAALTDWIVQSAPAHTKEVLLGGGCWVNRVLAHRVPALLAQHGIAAHLPHQAPAGDGGIALGEAWLTRLACAQEQSQYHYLGDRGAVSP